MDITLVSVLPFYDRTKLCEVDGVTEHWVDGHEMYWSCGNPAVVMINGILHCTDHLEDGGISQQDFTVRA